MNKLLAEKFTATTKDGQVVEFYRFKGQDEWMAPALGLHFTNVYAAKVQHRERFGKLTWKRTDNRKAA